MAGLTDVERREKLMSELDFQRLLVGKDGLANTLGWDHVHFRPAMTTRGWRTAGTGTMAAGWPDLVLVRARDRRLVFAELKRQETAPTESQWDVLRILGALAGDWNNQAGAPGVRLDVVLWRPSDLRDPVETSAIYRLLR